MSTYLCCDEGGEGLSNDASDGYPKEARVKVEGALFEAGWGSSQCYSGEETGYTTPAQQGTFIDLEGVCSVNVGRQKGALRGDSRKEFRLGGGEKVSPSSSLT